MSLISLSVTFALRSHQALLQRHPRAAASSSFFTAACGDSVSLEGPHHRKPDNMKDAHINVFITLNCYTFSLFFDFLITVAESV